MSDPTRALPETPWMTEGETACFKKWIPFGGSALEFGMGGSSRFFFDSGISTLVSVESDKNWAFTIAQDKFFAYFSRKGRHTIYYINIGEVGLYGVPVSTVPQCSWIDYHQTVWSAIAPEKLDFVLIDGRFRVACACQVILHCPQRPVVLIHDFWDRPEYHKVLDFMDILDKADTTLVARPKEYIDLRDVALTLQEYQLHTA